MRLKLEFDTDNRRRLLTRFGRRTAENVTASCETHNPYNTRHSTTFRFVGPDGVMYRVQIQEIATGP